MLNTLEISSRPKSLFPFEYSCYECTWLYLKYVILPSEIFFSALDLPQQLPFIYLCNTYLSLPSRLRFKTVIVEFIFLEQLYFSYI